MTLLPISIVGRPDARSDEAVARVFVRWLQEQHPGTSWTVRPAERAQVVGRDERDGLRRLAGGMA